MSSRLLPVLIALGFAGPVPALPLCGQSGPLILQTPADAETMAYGGAPWLFSTSAALLFGSPASLIESEGVASSLGTYGGAGLATAIAGSGPFLSGRFGLGLHYLRYEAESAFPVVPDRRSEALTSGPVGLHQFVVSGGYALTLRDTRIGGSVKYVEQSAPGSRDGTVALDLGIVREVGPLRAGLSVHDIGSGLEVADDSGPRALDLPTGVSASVSTESFEVGELDLHLTSRVLRRRDGEIVPAGGLEISYWPVAGYTFRLRAGLQRVIDDAREPFTLGAAFTGDHITIEYAFQPYDDDGHGHRFGLRWR